MTNEVLDQSGGLNWHRMRHPPEPLPAAIFDRLGIVKTHNATEAHAWEEEARARVENDNQLRPYYDTIFRDVPNWDAFMEWLCCADHPAIVEWVAVALECYGLP